VITPLRRHVLLDADDADYIARALQLLERLLRENRSQPTPRLQSTTTQLARSAAAGSAAGINGRNRGGCGASSDDTAHHLDYALLSTAEAARLLACGERNVRDLAARGAIPARRTGDRGRWLVDAAAVVARAERKAARRSRTA
jgi:excisionase family DNA binding protein